MWLDSFFEDLGLVLYNRAKTCKRREQSTCHRSHSAWKDLSLFPQSSRHTVQSCRRSLQILKVLTLSHQLQDTDVICLSESLWILSIYAVKVRAVKTYSRHIFDVHSFSIEVSVALLDVDVSALVCVRKSVHVPACTRAVINTPFLMSDKSMKNCMKYKKKKGISLASCSFSYLIDTMQLQRFMSPNIPGWVRLTATCGNMICF